MRNTIQLVVIIIAIVALIIIVGFVIGTMTHKMKSESESEFVSIIEIDDEVSEQSASVMEDLFSLQIMASSQYDNIKLLQEKLKQDNYETEISRLMRDNIIIYRLRLTGLYIKDNAVSLGEELKEKYEPIESYWLEEQTSKTASKQEMTKPQEIASKKQVNTESDNETKVTKKKIEFGQECEVQLLASGDYAKIEEIKTELETKGYKTKILTFTLDKSIIYRLRLRGLYSVEEGNKLGNKIIDISGNVSSFWLDEIVDGKSVGQIGTTVTKETKPEVKSVKSSTGDYEIQILANSKRNFVEEKKNILDKSGYRAKIVKTEIKGTTFYRLRLSDSYSRSKAVKVGDKLKKDVKFVTNYWIVPKAGVKTAITSTSKNKAKAKKKTPTKPEQYSMNPKYQRKNGKQQKTMTCTSNDINIRIGPGSYYAIDPIGKLMKGVTVFVVDEKNDWIKFTITPNDQSWAGWVNKKYLR